MHHRGMLYDHVMMMHGPLDEEDSHLVAQYAATHEPWYPDLGEKLECIMRSSRVY